MFMSNNYKKIYVNENNFKILEKICAIAENDPVAKKDCFSTNWTEDNASVIYQVKNGLMKVVILVENNSIIAMCGYSIHGDILFCPRRAYVVQEKRTQNLIAQFIMRQIEEEHKDKINYVLTSFNANHRGKMHFSLWCNHKYKNFYMKHDKYFSDFIPLTQDPVLIKNTLQFVIYKKIKPVEDLTIENVIRLLV